MPKKRKKRKVTKASGRKKTGARKKTSRTAGRKKKKSGRKKSARRSSARRYSPAASDYVREEMEEYKEGRARSGRSGLAGPEKKFPRIRTNLKALPKSKRKPKGWPLCSPCRSRLRLRYQLVPYDVVTQRRLEQACLAADEEPEDRLRRLFVYPQTVRTLIHGLQAPAPVELGICSSLQRHTANWLTLCRGRSDEKSERGSFGARRDRVPDGRF